jgi:hypothetical protein
VYSLREEIDQVVGVVLGRDEYPLDRHCCRWVQLVATSTMGRLVSSFAQSKFAFRGSSQSHRYDTQLPLRAISSAGAGALSTNRVLSELLLEVLRTRSSLLLAPVLRVFLPHRHPIAFQTK